MRPLITFILVACLMAGCKTSKTSTSTRVETKVETETESQWSAASYDSTGLDMSRQLSISARLNLGQDTEIVEEIETTTIAATDSTPATTTTRVKRNIKSSTKAEEARDVTATTEVNATEVKQDSAAEQNHSTTYMEKDLKEEKKTKSPTTIWYDFLFGILFLIFIILLIRIIAPKGTFRVK